MGAVRRLQAQLRGEGTPKVNVNWIAGLTSAAGRVFLATPLCFLCWFGSTVASAVPSAHQLSTVSPSEAPGSRRSVFILSGKLSFKAKEDG